MCKGYFQPPQGGGASMHPYKVLEGNEHAKAAGSSPWG